MQFKSQICTTKEQSETLANLEKTSLNENTIETLKDMVKDIEKVNEDIMNLNLMLDGKINESEFVDLVK
jgi:hypothetical protein